MKKIVIIILTALCVFLSAEAQDIKVTASFDSSRIFIGDQIGFTVTIDQPADVNVKLPIFIDTLIRNIEILSGPVMDTIKTDGKRLKISEKYLVTSFDSGYYEIHPVYAEIPDDSNKIKRYYSDYSRLEVMRVGIAPPDTTSKIFDIMAPYEAPLTFGEVLPWILIGLVSVAGLFLLVRYIGRLRKGKDLPAEAINIEPAHVIAFRELEKLLKEELWQKGEVKKYYTRLTEILRQYLENRYGILSLELTTEETLHALVKSGFKKDETYKMLEGILKGGDLVKFAKYRPSAEENEVHFANSYRFVELTRLTEKTGVEVENDKPAEVTV